MTLRGNLPWGFLFRNCATGVRCSSKGVVVRRTLLFLLVIALLSAGCGGDNRLDGARTYYESLDLGSPLKAAETFADAFARDDFMTVWLVLQADAQIHLQQALNMLRYGQFFDTVAFSDYRTALETEFLDMMSWDTHDAWYIFDRIMLFADRHDAFLIDLSGEVDFSGESPGARWGYTDLIAEVEGIEGDVTFRMTETLSGRWRVYQVIVPAGDEQSIPWAVPTANG